MGCALMFLDETKHWFRWWHSLDNVNRLLCFYFPSGLCFCLKRAPLWSACCQEKGCISIIIATEKSELSQGASSSGCDACPSVWPRCADGWARECALITAKRRLPNLGSLLWQRMSQSLCSELYVNRCKYHGHISNTFLLYLHKGCTCPAFLHNGDGSITGPAPEPFLGGFPQFRDVLRSKSVFLQTTMSKRRNRLERDIQGELASIERPVHSAASPQVVL